MTVEERVIDIKLKVENAETVRDLKAQSAELVSIIEELGQKTDKTEQEIAQYNDAVELLVNTQNRLTTVMKEGKSQLSAQEGSYNALVNRMAALKKVHKSVSDEFTRSRLSEEIEEINTQLKEMDAKNGVYVRNVGNYENAIRAALKTPQQELKSLRNELAQLDEGTAEYNATFAKMADLTHKVTEQQEMLKWSSADLGDILGNVAGVATSLAGGFSAFNALTGLVGGGESEELEKAMLQAQRFIQLIQGLEQFEQIFDKVKGLWTGIKNFATNTSAAVTSLSTFNQEIKTTESNVLGATQATSTSAIITGQAADANERATKALKELSKEELEQLSIMDQRIYYGERAVAQLRNEIALQKESLAVKKREGKDNEVKTIEKYIEKLETSLENEERRLKITKSQAGIITENTKATQANAAATNAQSAANVTAAATTGLFSKALGMLKTTLISTGIGAIVVALGALIGLLGKGLGKVWDWISGANAAAKATTEFTTAMETLNAQMSEADKEWERQEKLMKAQGKSAEELYMAEKEVIKAKLETTQALLRQQEAVAKDIGQRKLQKDKYEEFRETLKELKEQEKELQQQMLDFSWDEYCRKIEEAREVEEKRAEEKKRAVEKIIEANKKEKEEAEKLLKTLTDYYKTERQKLDEKYKKEKELLEKYGKDTTLLTKKYEEDKTKIVLEEESKRRKVREDFEKNLISSLEKPSKEYFEVMDKQLKKTVLSFADLNKDVGVGDIDINPLTDAVETVKMYKEVLESSPDAMEKFKEGIKKINAEYGLNIKTVDDFVIQMRIADKALRDNYKEWRNYDSDMAVKAIEGRIAAIQNLMEWETKQKETEYATYASQQDFYIGFVNNYITQMYRRWEVEDSIFQLRKSRILDEIAIYKAAAENVNLTEEERIAALQKAAELEKQLAIETADHTIAQNQRKTEATDNYVATVQSSLDGISSILGNVASAWETSIQSQIDSGKISEEEGEKEFEKMKGIQSAITLINTFSSAISAFQSLASIPFVGPALGAAAAAAAIASGMMQVKAINATKIGDKGGSGSSTRYTEVTPTLPTDYSPQMVQNVTGSQETENLANALSKQNIWVSVSDINNAQSRVKTREKESSF